MAYQKKYATEEERRLAKSIAGKKGAEGLRKSGNYKGGRPKGSRNKNPSVSEPTHSILVRESAYKVYVKCAGFSHKSLVDFMSIVAESLKKKNPQLFELHDDIRL